jgi:hypothetical protein
MVKSLNDDSLAFGIIKGLVAARNTSRQHFRKDGE